MSARVREYTEGRSGARAAPSAIERPSAPRIIGRMADLVMLLRAPLLRTDSKSIVRTTTTRGLPGFPAEG
jgi:hypothetical protein